MPFSPESFVADLRAAAADTHPVRAINAVMKEAVADPAAVAAGVPDYEGEELALLETDELSVYCARFFAEQLVPPHNHKIPAFIGVYEGTEINQLFRHDASGLTLVAEKHIGPGATLSIGSEGIHGVYTKDGKDSLALHVYLGSLKTISRSLFHPDSGEEMPFSDENYQALLRRIDRGRPTVVPTNLVQV